MCNQVLQYQQTHKISIIGISPFDASVSINTADEARIRQLQAMISEISTKIAATFVSIKFHHNELKYVMDNLAHLAPDKFGNILKSHPQTPPYIEGVLQQDARGDMFVGNCLLGSDTLTEWIGQKVHADRIMVNKNMKIGRYQYFSNSVSLI